MHIPSLYALLPFLLTSFAHAWAIDADCSPVQKRFLEQAIGSAFSANILSSVGLTSTDQQYVDLRNWLFGQDPNTRQRLSDKIEFIRALNRPNQQIADLGSEHFLVHCTENRIEKRGNRYFDTELGENIPQGAEKDCKSKTSAYTVNPQPFSDGTYPGVPYSIIQICPKFLDHSMNRDPQFRNLLDRNAAWKLMDRIAEKWRNGKKSGLDAQYLFDLTMLHEITHTKGAGHTIDVGGAANAYGWANCRRLANVITRWPDGTDPLDYWQTTPSVSGPEQNADNVAMFALGCRAIVDGAIILEDGNLAKRNARLARGIHAFRALSPWQG